MSDDPRAPHWTWLVAGALAALIVTVYARIDRARRAWRRARIALGALLIDVGVRVTPDIPPHVDPDYERMRRNVMAAVARERQGVRRNGHG